MTGQTNCYRCGAATGVDPCWNCGSAQKCASCSALLEGPFCTSCGTPAPASGPTAAGVAAAVQGHIQNTSGPAPEPPLDLDRSEEGANLIWAWRAVRANSGFLAGVWALSIIIAVFGTGAAKAVLALAGRSSSAWLTFFCSTGAAIIWIAAVTYSSAIMFRAWASLVRGTRPAAGWILRVPRFGSWTITYFLAMPLLVIPFGSAFGMQVLHHAAGDGTSPVESLGETLSRTTRESKTFLLTALVGILLWLYYVAIWIGFFALGGLLSGAATLGAASSYLATDSGNEGSAVIIVTFLLLLVIALVVLFALGQLVGMWTAVRTRRLTGRPVGQAAT
jgi:hypothetical protein